MASLAGAPYLSVWDATDDQILENTHTLADLGLIDSLENMERDKIYIYQGLVDTITPWCRSLQNNSVIPLHFRAGGENTDLLPELPLR